MKGEALSAHVGVSAPETPRYLLLNNFLSDFFEVQESAGDDYAFEVLRSRGILVCQESDPGELEKLRHSFDEFLAYFMGREQLAEVRSGKKKIYMPLSLELLGTANINLRHLLYHLAFYDDRHRDPAPMRKKIYDYLYGDSTGIYSIVSQFCDSGKEIGDNRKAPTGFEELEKMKFFRDLGKQFNQDLDTLLTQPPFIEQDFYKRLDDLAVLLTMYVVLFFVRRVHQGAEAPIMLCKGSTDSGLNDGGLHRICTANYQSFRNDFSKLLEHFYAERLRQQQRNGRGQDKGEEAENEGIIQVSNQGGTIYVEGEKLLNYASRVFEGNYRNEQKLNQKAGTVFQLGEGEIQRLTYEEFVECYLQLTGKISGTNQKRIFNVLQSSGKEIGFVYPVSRSKFKYFAMSGELTAFFVRLYLAGQPGEYAFLDDFLQYLETDYGIYIRKGKKTDRLVRKYGIRLAGQEFGRNEQAFLETLDRVNCLIRLSDSGYVITLPERKGGFRLL